MNLLAIDPGYAGAGNACAAFEAGVLVETWFEKAVTFAPRAPAGPARATRWAAAAGYFHEIVIERPQQDGRSRGVPPDTLIRLAWAGALLAGAFAGRDGAPIVEYTPSEWKGSEPKPVQHARLWTVLAEGERARLGGEATYRTIMAACEKGALKRWAIAGAACYPRSFTLHNILDAVALGCVHLGRLRKAGS